MAALSNPRYEKFVLMLITGMSQREAYRVAYPSAEKWKDNTVDVKASQLFANDKVRIRYNEIMDEQKETALLTRAEKRELLAEIARDSKEKAQDRIRAIDADNKMEGEYISKVEINKPVDDTIKELEEYFNNE